MRLAFSFDFGGTLAVERNPGTLRIARAALVRRACEDLADSDIVDAAWKEVLREMTAVERTGVSVNAAWAARRIVSRFAGPVDPLTTDELAAAIINPPEHPQSLELMPGASDLLDWLRSRGAPCAVLSNTGLSSGAYNRRWLDAAGIGDAFVADAVLFSDEIGVGKPHPASFGLCMEMIGQCAVDVMHVGDDPWFDVGGAKRCGMATVQLTTVGGDVVPDPAADHVVSDLVALHELIERLERAADGR